MKRTIKKTISCLLAVLCLVSCLYFPAAAASGKISFNDPTVTVGDTVTVKMKLSGTGLIAMDATLTYDASLLEYQSSSFSGVTGGSGSISISWYDTTGVGVDGTSISFTFKAKATGTAVIKPTSVEVTDINYENVELTSKGSSKVTINPVPTASSEARLSSLKVSPGTLSPGFDPDTTSYSVTVPAGTTKLTVTAKARDDGASASVSGTRLSVGTNTVTVTVTAEDGTTKKYTIKVTRPADPVEPDPGPDPDPDPDPVVEPLTVVIDQTTWYVDEGMDGITPPEGFEKGLTTYQEREIVVAKGAEKPLVLMHLTDAEGENGALFLYDAATNSFQPYREVTTSAGSYTLLSLPETAGVPVGYAAREGYALGEQRITVYVSQENPEALPLVYAMNPKGESDFYRYDPAEGTLQRYVAEWAPTVVDPVIQEDPALQQELQTLQQENDALKAQLAQQNQTDGEDDLRLLILFCVAAAELLLIVVLIVVLCTRKRTGGKGGGYQGSRSA